MVNREKEGERERGREREREREREGEHLRGYTNALAHSALVLKREDRSTS